MGNGEQYIWKPPEEDDIIFQHKQMGIQSSHAGENMAASAAGVSVHLVFHTVLRNILYFSFCAVKKSCRVLYSLETLSVDDPRALPYP